MAKNGWLDFRFCVSPLAKAIGSHVNITTVVAVNVQPPAPNVAIFGVVSTGGAQSQTNLHWDEPQNHVPSVLTAFLSTSHTHPRRTASVTGL